MIQLQKSASNVIARPLQGEVSLSNPYFLFVFTSESTGVSYAVILTDESTPGAQQDRSNLFTLIEGTTDPTNGEIILGNAGQYNYIIYEQNSSTNLDPTLSGSILERGNMRLIGVTEASDFLEHEIVVTYVEHSIV